MSNFGFHRLRVVNPYQVAFRQARSAVGAADVLASAEEYATLAEAVADCVLVVGTTAVRHRDLQHPLHSLGDDAGNHIRQALRSDRVGLLFGSEKAGLSNEDLCHCRWLLHIPTRDGHISMNLGQAVAVCLYELARSGKSDASSEVTEGAKPATAGDEERVTLSLLEALRASGYMNPGMEQTIDMKVRRMVRRLELCAPDADAWLGMLRQIIWKLTHDKQNESSD